MPHMRHFRGGYAVCADWQTGAFEVSQSTVDAWLDRCHQAGHGQPRSWNGYRLRPYPELDVASHRPYASDGVYTDHRDPDVEAALYAERDRLNAASNGERQAILQGLASTYGLRHWRDAYNTARNVGRRHTGESGRDANGDLRWRRWNRQHSWSTTTAATVHSNGHRAFGVEIEFNMERGHDRSDAQYEIERQARAAGLAFHAEWGTYNTAGVMRHNGGRRPVGWLGTYDSTVTGGEIISDLLAGDDASLEEVRTMLAIVVANGGTSETQGNGTYTQGIHTNHDVRDFSHADKIRLVDNLQQAAPILEQYLPRCRVNGGWSSPMTAADWAGERRRVVSGNNGCGSHRYAYNLGHLFVDGYNTPSALRVEFRAFGASLSSTKLRCWIRVGQAIMRATKAGIVFAPGIDRTALLTVLQANGLSAAAARRFENTCAARQMGRRPVTV